MAHRQVALRVETVERLVEIRDHLSTQLTAQLSISMIVDQLILLFEERSSTGALPTLEQWRERFSNYRRRGRPRVVWVDGHDFAGRSISSAIWDCKACGLVWNKAKTRREELPRCAAAIANSRILASTALSLVKPSEAPPRARKLVDDRNDINGMSYDAGEHPEDWSGHNFASFCPAIMMNRTVVVCKACGYEWNRERTTREAIPNCGGTKPASGSGDLEGPRPSIP